MAIARLVLGGGDPNAAKASLRWVRQLLAADAVNLQDAIVAQDLKRPAMIGIHNHRLRVEVLQLNVLDGFRFGVASGPLKEPRFSLRIKSACHDDVSVLPVTEVADAQPAQVQEDGIAELSPLAVEKVVGIEQGNNQGLAARDGVAEPDQDMLVRSRAKRFDIQSARQHGGECAVGAQFELFEPPFSRQIHKQILVRLAYGRQTLLCFVPARGKEVMPAAPVLALMISPVGRNPKNPIPEPRSPLQISLRPFALDSQEEGQIEAANGQSSFLRAVNPNRVVLIVGDRKQILVSCDRR